MDGDRSASMPLREARRVSAKRAIVFVLALVALGGFALFGCQFIVGIPDVTLSSSSGEGGGPASNDPCGTLLSDGGSRPGPTMVKVDSPKGSYCIDTTEVTVADFNAYIAASDQHVDTPPTCDTAIAPPHAISDPNLQNHAVGGVGICDAWSYCQWAGKRLCGAIGDAGSIYGSQDLFDTEWYFACINGQANTAFPYGDTYDPTACNTESDASVPVGSMSKCHGTTPPFDEIFDMSGNEAELVNDVSVSQDSVGSRGGSYVTGANANCAAVAGANGYIFDFDDNGFRCCANP